MHLSRMGFGFALALAMGTASIGCTAEELPPVNPEDLGHIILPVTATDTSGNLYVLQNAQFEAFGPAYFLLNGDGEGELQIDAPFGDYQVQLLPGWQMTRKDAVTGELTNVDAVLASQNPQSIRVQPGTITLASFNFLLGGDNGTLALGVYVVDKVDAITAKFKVTSDQAFDLAGQSLGPWAGVEGATINLLTRFGRQSWYSGEFSDGTKYRGYFGYPAHVTVDNDPSGVLTAYANKLSGANVSLDLRTVPSTVEGAPPTIAMTLYMSTFRPDESITWLSINNIGGYTYFDEDGFPTLGGIGDMLAPDFTLAEAVKDATENFYRTVGMVNGSGQINVNIPLAPTAQ